MRLANFKLDECAGSRRDFVVARSNWLAASTACQVRDRWFAPHIFIFAEFNIPQGVAEVSFPGVTHLVWPACWVDAPNRSASSAAGMVQDIWDLF